MKILFYLPTPGGMTGAPKRMLALARGLRELGMSPVIVSEPNSELLRSARSENIETIELLSTGVLGLREGALFGGGVIFRLRIAFCLLWHQFVFFRLIMRTKPDIIWTRGSKGISFAALGIYLSRRPLVWDIDYELPSRGVIRLLHKSGLWLASKVVFQYRSAEQIFGNELAKLYASKFRVIIPGVNIDALEEKINKGKLHLRSEFQILQVGTICDRKNQLFTIRLASSLSPELKSKVSIYFVGATHSADYEHLLRSKISKAGLSENVKFLGWRTDVAELMLNSDLILMPSKDEGVPNTVQEAMILDTPVLASDSGGIPEIISTNRNGWAFPLTEFDRWVDTLDKLVQSPEHLKEVGKSARSSALLRFGTDTWCKEYALVIKEVIK